MWVGGASSLASALPWLMFWASPGYWEAIFAKACSLSAPVSACGGREQVHAQFPVCLARRQNTAELHSNGTTSHHLQLLASSWPSWGSPQPPHGLPGGKPHLPHGLPGGVPDFPLTFLGGHSKASLMDISKSWTRCCRLWLLMPLVISAGAKALHGPLCPVLLQPTGSHDAMRSVNQVSVDSAGLLP